MVCQWASLRKYIQMDMRNILVYNLIKLSMYTTIFLFWILRSQSQYIYLLHYTVQCKHIHEIIIASFWVRISDLNWMGGPPLLFIYSTMYVHHWISIKYVQHLYHYKVDAGNDHLFCILIWIKFISFPVGPQNIYTV